MAKVLDIETFVRDSDWLNDQDCSTAQMAILKASYGLPLTKEEMDVFLELTEGRKPQKGGYSEITLICGIRSGKTDKFAANIAAYEAITFDNRILAPGERAIIPVVAQNILGAQTAWGYVEGKVRLLEEKGVRMPDGKPLLDPGTGTMKSITGKEIRFSNRVTVATYPCNKSGVRGKTCVSAIGDEFAFWDTADTAESSDVEIFRALRGRMATMRGRGKLVKITSPYVEAGVAYDDYQKRKTARRLFVQAPSWVLNPNLSKRFLDEQRDLDPDGFNREYGAQFGKGGGTYLTSYQVDDAMDMERPEVLQPLRGIEYFGWVDVAFKHDLYAFGIAHRHSSLMRIVFDLIAWWKGTKKDPLDGRVVAGDISKALKAYGLGEVRGDQYAAIPTARDFKDHGIHFIEVPDTADRSWEMFQLLKAQLRHKGIELPKSQMIRQDLLSLVLTRTGNNGTPRVAAPNRAGFHDDISKVIASLTLHLAPNATNLDISEWNQGSTLTKSKPIWYNPERTRPKDDDEFGEDELADNSLLDKIF